MKNVWKIFDRLRPGQWRRRKPGSAAGGPEELNRLWARADDANPALQAIMQLLGERLEESAAMAGAITTSDTDKLRYCERMECFRMLMVDIELRRTEARQWERTQEEQRKQSVVSGQ